MVKSCAAYGCTNRFEKGRNVQFHSFPLKNESLLQKWLEKIRRKNFVPLKCSFICSEHFCDTDYLHRPGTSVRKLKPNAFPSVFTGFPQYYQPKTEAPRFSVINKLVELCNVPRNTESRVDCEYLIPEVLYESLVPEVLNGEAQVGNNEPPTRDIETQTECEANSANKEQIKVLEKKVKLLQQKVRRKATKISNLQELLIELKTKGMSQNL